MTDLELTIKSLGLPLRASYTVTEAAQILGCTGQSIRIMCASGTLKSFKLRSHIRIFRVVLAEFTERGAQ